MGDDACGGRRTLGNQCVNVRLVKVADRCDQRLRTFVGGHVWPLGPLCAVRKGPRWSGRDRAPGKRCFVTFTSGHDQLEKAPKGTPSAPWKQG